jgi:nucleosome binding factor SPN SPT16 subunit
MNTFKFYRLINNVGYYGKISLEVTQTDTKRLNMEYDSYVEEEWRNIIESGAKYFFEHYSKDFNKGLNILVKDLHSMIVDTSSIVIFYITTKCLVEILEYPKGLVEFNEENGTFIFKK